MKATYMYDTGDARVESVLNPAIKQPTDAIVRVARSCVFGSDLHPDHSMSHSESGGPKCHEAIGGVEATGLTVAFGHTGVAVVHRLVGRTQVLTGIG